MKCLLIPLALWLGMVGIHGTEPKLSETQRRGLQVALEEFHKHPPVQWAFQETSVDSAEETVSTVAGRERRAEALDTSDIQKAFLGKATSQTSS